MFFDIGWPELMLIGVVALVVIGPKDLPAALRVAGYWVRKARTMSREFQSSVEQMLVTDINLDHEMNKIMDPVHDPAIAGATETVPKPEVPDYLDHTPAPADPVAPAVEHAETVEAVPAEEAAPEPAAPEHATAEDSAMPLPPAAEEHPAHSGPPAKP
jgi:sec-independent protein translocase protein TatB